jgi:hypothetical protein
MTNYVFKFPNILKIVKVKIVVVKFVNPAPWRGETRERFRGFFRGYQKTRAPAFKKGGPVFSTCLEKIAKNIYCNSHLFVCVQKGFVKSVFYGYEDGNKKITHQKKNIGKKRTEIKPLEHD